MCVDDRSCFLALDSAPATLHERGAEDAPDATITGTEADWIAALGPAGALDALAVTGDVALAGGCSRRSPPARTPQPAEVHAA